MKSIQLFLFGSFFVTFASTQNIQAQIVTDSVYSISNNGNCIELLNNESYRIKLNNCSESVTQFWQFVLLPNGYYRLINLGQGKQKSLDIINDGKNNKLKLATTANVTGQFWKTRQTQDGSFILTTKWLGETKCLTIVNNLNGIDVELQTLTPNNPKQVWRILPRKIQANKELNDSITKVHINGFTLFIPKHIMNNTQTQAALNLIEEKLSIIKTMLKQSIYNKLTQVPIWLEYKQLNDGAVWYHAHKSWLIRNGYPAIMEKSVEIKNINNFINWHKDQPFMLLHELAHAHHDKLNAYKRALITACFKKAVESKKYESVPYIKGGRLKHYALNNESEFFAELTEAYFGKNDYYPFVKEDLKSFDPEGYALMEIIWEIN